MQAVILLIEREAKGSPQEVARQSEKTEALPGKSDLIETNQDMTQSRGAARDREPS